MRWGLVFIALLLVGCDTSPRRTATTTTGSTNSSAKPDNRPSAAIAELAFKLYRATSIPPLSLRHLKVGDIGILQRAKVLQVASDNLLLAELDDERTVLLQIPTTRGLTDGVSIDLSTDVAFVAGTQSYTTVLGASKTVFHIITYDRDEVDAIRMEKLREFTKVEAEKQLEFEREHAEELAAEAKANAERRAAEIKAKAKEDAEKRVRAAAAKLALAKKLAESQPETSEKFLRELETRFADTPAGAEAKAIRAKEVSH